MFHSFQITAPRRWGSCYDGYSQHQKAEVVSYPRTTMTVMLTAQPSTGGSELGLQGPKSLQSCTGGLVLLGMQPLHQMQPELIKGVVLTQAMDQCTNSTEKCLSKIFF